MAVIESDSNLGPFMPKLIELNRLVKFPLNQINTFRSCDAVNQLTQDIEKGFDLSGFTIIQLNKDML
jgi:hypothetical protein